MENAVWQPENKVKLSGFPTSLSYIRGKLWSCQWNGIYIYNKDLELKHKFPCAGQSRVWDVTQTDTGVAIARSNGLFLWTSEGKFWSH